MVVRSLPCIDGVILLLKINYSISTSNLFNKEMRNHSYWNLRNKLKFCKSSSSFNVVLNQQFIENNRSVPGCSEKKYRSVELNNLKCSLFTRFKKEKCSSVSEVNLNSPILKTSILNKIILLLQSSELFNSCSSYI